MMASSPEPVSIMDQPLSNLGRDTFATLCVSLTTCEGLGGRTWEGLGGKIGFNTRQLKLLKIDKESNKGWLLLDTWEKLDRRGATVKRLIIALESLKMRDCVKLLQEAASISGKLMSRCFITVGRFI